jgi:hypothetical protein
MSKWELTDELYEKAERIWQKRFIDTDITILDIAEILWAAEHEGDEDVQMR